MAKKCSFANISGPKIKVDPEQLRSELFLRLRETGWS